MMNMELSVKRKGNLEPKSVLVKTTIHRMQIMVPVAMVSRPSQRSSRSDFVKF